MSPKTYNMDCHGKLYKKTKHFEEHAIWKKIYSVLLRQGQIQKF